MLVRTAMRERQEAMALFWFAPAHLPWPGAVVEQGWPWTSTLVVAALLVAFATTGSCAAVGQAGEGRVMSRSAIASVAIMLGKQEAGLYM